MKLDMLSGARKYGRWVTLGAMGIILITSMHCASKPRVGLEGVAEPSSQSSQYSSYLLIHDARLGRQIEIADIKTRNVGDIMQLSVTLMSRTKRAIHVSYKFAWFDTDGFEVRPEDNPWIPLTVYGNETKTVQGMAPNPTAISFKINIMKK